MGGVTARATDERQVKDGHEDREEGSYEPGKGDVKGGGLVESEPEEAEPKGAKLVTGIGVNAAVVDNFGEILGVQNGAIGGSGGGGV